MLRSIASFWFNSLVVILRLTILCQDLPALSFRYSIHRQSFASDNPIIIILNSIFILASCDCITFLQLSFQLSDLFEYGLNKKRLIIQTCKRMARDSVPFTEGHYYGRGERPNTELADNSPSTCREIHNSYHKYFSANSTYFVNNA